MAIARLVSLVGNKSQVPTQRYGRRPFGVGLLVAGYDEQGPHIYQTCPSANYFDCKAMAIGARLQSARTYLERNLDAFPEAALDDLIKHGLRALRDTLPNDVELTTKNCSIGIVGKDQDFTIYDDDQVEKYVKMIEGEERSPGAGKDEDPAAPDPGQKMDLDDQSTSSAPVASAPVAGAPQAQTAADDQDS